MNQIYLNHTNISAVVLVDLEAEEAEEVVWLCLVISVDRQFSSVSFSIPFHPSLLAFCTTELSQTAPDAVSCGDGCAI